MRRRMLKLGMSPADLSRELGVDKSIVSRLLAGETDPSLKLAIKLAKSKLRIPERAWA